ncbi:putative thiol oxidoreductase [Terriglobus roseus DSM 18391]|uniref:Putative thiol oxidoreductase n=1 Tax=Terriglobus roseus (strain DSM 18391 / NRRL B-41598 / KBS 63) TaxID=926566 RepID=I3ZIV3_TERRK|nr:di-heme oxidoredictase family protein [Terriglobus roseus]AFL89171.1 putative thiol oxidoreductase [Terriglobus roseus DSM 18391]
MKPVYTALPSLILLLSFSVPCKLALAQHTPPGFRARDPGPRPNPKSAIPNPVPGLNENEIALFTESLLRVSELEGTCDTCVQQPQGVLPIDPDPSNPFSPKKLINSAGMGPVFNADQCFTCHSQPAIGGSAQRKNAAFEVAGRMGANNIVPSFEERNGAFREVRFKFGRDGARDGGVHSLFTLAGRSDIPASCRVRQPDFDKEMRERNLAFRIPLQLFGLGLIESIQDSTIRDNMRADREEKRALGIEGRPNINPNTGTISRFGWKAQNASLTVFAGEAYNVEMGISNDLFPISRNEDSECNKAYEPFDVPRTDGVSYNNPLKIMPAWLMFTEFMRFVDAPQPAPMSASASRGRQLFKDIGCSFCHTPSMQTPGTANPSGQWDEIGAHTVALRGQSVNLYSDLLVHHMGATMADNIVQGNAGPDEFRTTPLWGLGQRIYFLHDGRTSDLATAIQDHFSFPGFDGGDNPAKDRDSARYGFSEANGTVSRFNRLPEVDKQSILDFLRTL